MGSMRFIMARIKFSVVVNTALDRPCTLALRCILVAGMVIFAVMEEVWSGEPIALTRSPNLGRPGEGRCHT